MKALTHPHTQVRSREFGVRSKALLLRTPNSQLPTPFLFIIAGFLPVSSIALHCLGVLPLQLCLFLLILPMLTLAAAAGVIRPVSGRVALRGWLSGILAVALYDLSRLPFILYGWADFIPHIGAWLTDTQEPSVWIGYTWRYAGNGGGLGMAFFMLVNAFGKKEKLLRAGLAFGLFVFAGLLAILVIFHEAQDMMFHLTPLTFTGSFTGHLIFGLVLGVTAKKFFSKKKNENKNAAFSPAV